MMSASALGLCCGQHCAPGSRRAGGWHRKQNKEASVEGLSCKEPRVWRRGAWRRDLVLQGSFWPRKHETLLSKWAGNHRVPQEWTTGPWWLCLIFLSPICCSSAFLTRLTVVDLWGLFFFTSFHLFSSLLCPKLLFSCFDLNYVYVQLLTALTVASSLLWLSLMLAHSLWLLYSRCLEQ